MAAVNKNVVVGIDLGRIIDNSAACILEHYVEVRELPFPTREEIVHKYEVLDLKRWPLLTSYTTVVRDIGAMMKASGLEGAQLVIDATGVGRDVYGLFENAYKRGLLGDWWPRGMIITGSTSDPTGDTRNYQRVAKIDLVGKGIAAFEGQLLTIPAELPDAAHLRKEIENFRRTISKRGQEAYAAAGTSEHDDLVSSLLLAMHHHNIHTEPRRVVAAGFEAP